MSCQNLAVQNGFYDIGGYKTNIKRIKDGVDELDELSKMIKERAEIEAKYGKALQQWHEKWVNHVDAKVLTGTIRDSWSNVLEEGNELSKLHIGLKERFTDEIVKTIALFKKENHHSRPFGGNSKEIHEISEAFEKAQKQWKKLYEKLESSKKNYFSACRNEKSAFIQLSNAQSDSSMSADASEKLRERLEKCKEDSRKARTSYEAQLAEIDKYKSVYIENMGFVFEKCQQMELKRMKFAMEMIGAIQNVLGDLVEAEKLRNLHRDMKDKFRSIGETEFQADLKEWSKVYGVDAPTQWPVFEDYTPEMRNITFKQTKEVGGIVLTKRVVNSDELPGMPKSRPMSASDSLTTNATIDYGTPLHRQSSCGSSSQENDHGHNIADSKSSTRGSKNSNTLMTPVLRNSNRNQPVSPFGDPFPMRTPDSKAQTSKITPSSRISDDSGSFDDQKDSVDSNGNECDDETKYGNFPGQMRGTVVALYNYIPIEEDEMALTKGEHLEVISGPDHLGWCMGRKKDESGLFPASYVAPV